ncbi:DHS-like NAD/FAD-binding domain-containing protein [Phellopilus nigrolimitatus]|nr:DHS-like NAD/FAD-binding domain-containing protein [Phellopilus nigrolimitatus]
MDSVPSNDLIAFKSVLSSSKKIVAIAGAGLSTASGLPTWRSENGIVWRKYDSLALANKAAFLDSPSRVWQYYHRIREAAREAEPNEAHRALALFSVSERRERVATGSTFTLITQNVDELSERALDDVLNHRDKSTLDARPDIIAMHGRVFDVVCTAYNCGYREKCYNSPICPALEGTEKIVDAGVPEPDISKPDLPRCRKCGELGRPGVVWFGEVPERIKEILDLVDQADLCLVVGTSSLVHPAAKLASRVKEHGGKVAVFNLERSKRDEEADFLFLGSCEKTLPHALGMDAI